jgi:tRNA(Ile)-lysidine synthase
MDVLPLLRKALGTIRDERLFRAGETVVVAVSGGADSVALLDLLATRRELGLRPVVAHLNHLLRGDESAGDEAFVRGLAKRYGVSAEIGAVDVQALSTSRRLSLEEAGREARYTFLREVAARHDARVIALAHHADDQAETLLMHLLRGAGGSGLAGMRPSSAGGHLVRPLLACYRHEVEAYLLGRGLAWREDSSNRDLSFLRNRVRHELLPLLATYNPAVAERLVTTAAALAGDELLLTKVVEEAAGRCLIVVSPDKVTASCAALRQELAGSRPRLYRYALAAVKGDLRRIGSRHLQAIERLYQARRPAGVLHLPGGISVSRSYDLLAFAAGSPVQPTDGYELVVDGPGTYEIDSVGVLEVTAASPPGDWGQVPTTTAYVDLAAVPFPWLIRPLRPGDRFVPLGMSGSRKVKAYYIDQKIPVADRRRIPLVFSGPTLFWLAGLRLAQQARLTPASRQVCRLSFVPCQL